eukprot:GEMP01036266.1.p1 GENE.GEMP01036266.1~~GEMP01036266.1.p1  ORF type:complete len:489 (+),score=91.19 GEMP01036266.1:137-1603(+)
MLGIRRILVRACATAAPTLQPKDAQASAQALIRRVGKADGSSQWREFTKNLLDETQSYRPKDLPALINLVDTLTDDAELTHGAFWYDFTASMRGIINQGTLKELLHLARKYAFLNCRSEILFDKLISEGRKLLNELEHNQVSLLVDLLVVLGAAKVSNKVLFRELADHLMEDLELVNAFTDDELIKVVESMSELRILHKPLIQHLGRHRLHQADLTSHQTARLARAYGRLGYRHDSAFKKWVKEMLRFHELSKLNDNEDVENGFAAGQMASVLEAMMLCKRHRGKTEWWDAEQDFNDLTQILAKRLGDESHILTSAEVASACWTLGKVKYVDDALCVSLLDRLKILLVEKSFEERTLGRPHLERSLDGIVHMGKRKKKDVDILWVTQWMCQNVYNISIQDVALINRWVADLGYSEHSYYEIFIPYFLDRIDDLTREDVRTIQDTYNKIKMDDEKLGRHFFYMLGKRFQTEHVDAIGVKKKHGAIDRIG